MALFRLDPERELKDELLVRAFEGPLLAFTLAITASSPDIEPQIVMSEHTVLVITVSDTASANASQDRSGPALVEILETHNYSVSTAICRDDAGEVRNAVTGTTKDGKVDLIITTGGTGFGQRDVTPEAIEPLITRKTPALTHALTAHSLNKTPMAALSRGITGIIKAEAGNEALVVTLPGSPKAVKECMEILMGDGLLSHALDLLGGGSGKRKHEEMQGSMHRDAVSTATDTGHAHSHHHHHNHHHHHGHGGVGGGLHSHSAPRPRTTPADHASFRTADPSSGPSLRHRVSPYPLLSLDDALSLIARHTPPATRTETLPVNSNLTGYVIAEDISATSDLPPGPTTNVDGYAVKSSLAPPGDYEVVTLNTLSNRTMESREIFRINTGQGLPADTDAVVMVEDTELLTSTPSGEESTVKILAQVDAGENVRPRGSDVRAGQIVLRRGTSISALGGEIGTLAFLGRSSVSVYRKPTIAILSTGNELRDPSSSSPSSSSAQSWGFEVFDANRPSLHAAIANLGFHVLDLGIVSDDITTTLTALQRGVEQADVIVTTGGTSMGESDLLKPLIERRLGGEIHFGRVAMKPGKPTTFASLPNHKNKLVFALPGNPASALVTFYVFVLPALRKLSGHPARQQEEANGWSIPRTKVNLGSQMKLDPRPEFHRVVVRAEGERGLVAYSTGSQRSSGMHSMSTANALIALPALEPGAERRVLPVGATAEAMILGSIM